MSTLESPCVSVCEMNAENTFCTGCWRSREEIGGWRVASDDTKREILTKSNERREAAGGRARRVTKRQAPKS